MSLLTSSKIITDYASDEALMIPLLSHEDGVDTRWVGIFVPDMGLFYYDAPRNSQAAENVRRAARNGSPQPVTTTSSGAVIDQQGRKIGKLLQYDQRPVSTINENPGDVRIIQQTQSNDMIPTNNGRRSRSAANTHGADLISNIHEEVQIINNAVDTGDEDTAERHKERLAQYVGYICLVLGGEPTEDGLDFEPETPEAVALRDYIMGDHQTEEAGVSSVY